MGSRYIAAAAFAAGTTLSVFSAQAAGDLNLICSADVVICEQMKGDFEKAVRKALAVAHCEDATHLPGYCGTF